MTTRSSRTQKSKGHSRRAPSVSQTEEEGFDTEIPTCSGAINEEEDVWEKYVRDDPKAKKAAAKSPTKRDRYPKRVHIVSQDEEESGSEKETPTVVENEEMGTVEEGEGLVEESGEKVVVDSEETKESE